MILQSCATGNPTNWRQKVRSLFVCILIVILFFLTVVVFTEQLPIVLRRILPDCSFQFHSGTEGDGQTVLRILGFMLMAVFVTWIGIRREGAMNLGLTLHGWQRSLVLIAVPYGMCVVVALIKPGSWWLEEIVVWVWLGLSVGLAEEVVFRGMIMHRLKSSGFSVSLAVTIQALLFSLIHIPSYRAHFWTAIPLAIFCGVSRQYSGSLVGPIILHGTRGLFLVGISDKRFINDIFFLWMTGLSVIWYIGFLVLEWKKRAELRSRNQSGQPTSHPS